MNTFYSQGLTVTSLLDRSVESVLGMLPQYSQDLHVLPPNLKNKFLYLMSSRNLFTDQNIGQLLHDRVRKLDLSDCQISDSTLEHISLKCPMLQKIKLNSVTQGRPAITSRGVLMLADRCRHLQEVHLLRCQNLTDEPVISLARGCARLSLLSLGGCVLLTDASLYALAEHATFLKSLDISKSQVTDAGVCALGTGVTASSLKELHLSGCRAITDESIEGLVAFCTQMEYLLFHDCPKVTESARDALQQAQLKHVTWTVY